MPNPFNPKHRQVLTVEPANCWRSREQPYDDLPWPDETRAFFIDREPSKWMYNEVWKQRYIDMYGDGAKAPLEKLGVVAEHMNPVYVAGSKWQTDPVVPIWGPEPTDPGGFATLEERVAALERYVYR